MKFVIRHICQRVTMTIYFVSNAYIYLRKSRLQKMLRPQIDLPHGHTFLIADNSLATRWQVMADVRRSGCREWRAEFAKADIPAGLKDGFVGLSGQAASHRQVGQADICSLARYT